jgi:hypothetical protein
VRAERFHLLDRRFEYSAKRAAPAGVRGADDACLAVCQQDRSAIGGDDAENQARGGGRHRIGLRALIGRERRIDSQRARRMNLLEQDEFAAGQDQVGLGLARRPDGRQEAVRHSGERLRPNDFANFSQGCE